MLLVTKSQHLRQSRTWGARAVPSGRKTSTGSRAAATQYLHAMPAAQFHNTAEMINDRLVGACSMCCSLWGYFAKETAQTGLSAGTSQPAGGQKQPISVKGAHAEAWLPRAVKFGPVGAQAMRWTRAAPWASMHGECAVHGAVHKRGKQITAFGTPRARTTRSPARGSRGPRLPPVVWRLP